MATSRFGHMCDWRCRNYPLQTCSDVCGVIVLIIAALAALDRPLFQFLIGPSEKSQVYLQRPSQHAYFLRRIIMCWFAESRIEINYVLLHHDWRDNVLQSLTTPLAYVKTRQVAQGKSSSCP